jgi:hypothetical protein
MIWYIFVNCKWVATRWQLYNTHLHTNNTQNDTKQTIHRTTQNLSTAQNLRTIQKVCHISRHILQQMLKMSSPLVNAHLTTSTHGLSHICKGHGEVVNGLTDIKFAVVKCLFVLNWSWIHWGVLSIPLDENLKDWGRVNLGDVPCKLSMPTYTGMRFFLVLLWEIRFWSLSKHFRCTLCIVTL